MSDLYVWLRSLWLLWLVLLFVGVAVWIYWPKRRDQLERHGQIPFKDEEEP
jgi:cytochrome c oxidase cbb3-type subunit IV